MKVMFVLIVHKKEVPAGSNPGERIYNHSVKRQHPLLERNWESMTRSWKDSEPALNWCLQYLCDSACAHELCKCVRLSCWWCSVSFGDRLILCRFILQAALADDGQRMGFCIEDPVLQWEEVVIREEQVQIPEQTGKLIPSKSGLIEYFTSAFCCQPFSIITYTWRNTLCQFHSYHINNNLINFIVLNQDLQCVRAQRRQYSRKSLNSVKK